MILCDVNVLVHAHRRDAPRHDEIRRWLEGVLEADEAYGVSTLVLSSFLRVVTHPRIFDPPSAVDDALQFVDVILAQPGAVVVAPGPRHWEIFRNLCRQANAKGNLIPDAYLAAIAIEHGCEWISLDRDFARFPSLRWRTPSEPA